MKKIILNACYGGYSWSQAGISEVLARKAATDIHPVDDVWSDTVKARLNGKPVTVSCLDVDRDDPIAIAVLEEKGPEFCSGKSADLVIEEYDDDKFIAHIDEYDGLESLKLIPKLSEKRIRECSSVDEIVALLDDLGLFTVNE